MDLAARELGRLGPPEPAEDYSLSDEAYTKPSVRERLQEALPELLGADELKDENDILFIANRALLEGKRDPADLISWLARQENLAKMSKMWVEDNKYQRPPPRVQQIAKYLRWCETNARKFAPR